MSKNVGIWIRGDHTGSGARARCVWCKTSAGAAYRVRGNRNIEPDN